jgi:hypothetical protein
MPVARLIATAPTDDPERTLLLFCPEQGGWQNGLFFEGRWLDFATTTVELEPTHWLSEPPELDDG